MSHTDWTKSLLIQTFLLKRSVPKKSLARTSSSAKNQCAPARRICIHFWRIPLWILCKIQAETIGTRFARPACWLQKSRAVRCLCPRRESTSHFLLRTELFYPLNYEGFLVRVSWRSLRCKEFQVWV